MRRAAIVVFAGACATLMGCASLDTKRISPDAFRCTNTDSCRVMVSVPSCNAVQVPKEKQQLEIKGRHVAIVWELDDAAVLNKYRFASENGVVLKPSSPDPNQQFSGQTAIAGRTAYLWIDLNSDYVTYDYSINLINLGDPTLKCRLDPQIANN